MKPAFPPHVRAALASSDVYVTTAIVGTLINLYGQILVPCFYGDMSPFSSFGLRALARPLLVAMSVGVGYTFPFCVSVVSTALSHYRSRRIESLAQFPDTKPDPVFRVDHDGAILEMGAPTQAMFERHNVQHARDILGDAVWTMISECPDCGSAASPDAHVRFVPENATYLVVWSKVPSGVNVYLTRTRDS